MQLITLPEANVNAIFTSGAQTNRFLLGILDVSLHAHEGLFASDHDLVDNAFKFPFAVVTL